MTKVKSIYNMTSEEKDDLDNRNLFEGISKQSGLNFSNILNSIYVVRNKDPINKKLPIQEQIDLAKRNLGLKEIDKPFNLDTYYGSLIEFVWHTNALRYEINELIKIFPNDKEKLEAIKRRLGHLKFLETEIKYIIKRYDFDRIYLLVDWLTNKFEMHATLTAEVCLIIIEYYHNRLNKTNNSIRFEQLVDYIYDVDKIFKYLNSTVNGFVITTIRNEIVHSTGYKINRVNDNFIINIEDVEINKKFGIMESYIKDVFTLFYSGKKVPQTYISVKDMRFPYINLVYPISKTGTIVYYDTKMNIELDLENYLKISSNYIYLLGITLFSKMISDNRI